MEFRGSVLFIGLKVVVCLLITGSGLMAQETDSTWTSADTLTATVKAYAANRPPVLIPAAISVINQEQLLRFTNTSLVSALNMEPGTRMEERSPGSYRLNLRGSSLRSPFGVRNVKMYLNEIPFTDPSGNTYLNQLDFRNIQSIEITRGPAGSMYGAGTGGAMLLHSMQAGKLNHASAELSGGSFGLFAAAAAISFGSANAANNIQYVHQQSDGWREHTAMRRDVASYENRMKINEKQSLQTILLYGNLYYQTPGGLTLAQFSRDPGASRPASGPFPSTEVAKAAIYQESFLAGISHEYHIGKGWKNTTSLYGACTWFKNPTFRLYEKRTEPHFGGRSFFMNDVKAGNSLLHFVYGAEAQKGIFTSNTYRNASGNPDTVLTNDEIGTWRYSLFAQAEWLFGKGWNITAGASYNHSQVSINRLLVYPNSIQERNFNSDVAPRLAVMKSFRQLNIYAVASKGFSPPTTAELLPGTGEINTTLAAENGINYEAGIKQNKKRFSYAVAFYHFILKDAISLRRDSGGGDFYVNAGETKQDGIELSGSIKIIEDRKSFISNLDLFTAYTGNFYNYSSYKVIGNNYSGNALPGIPKNNWVIGMDIMVKQGFYSNINFSWVDKIPLNDANDPYAPAYHLLNARAGWRNAFNSRNNMDVFIAADNLLDEIYSLGNDINAAGGRYYNAAPRRNFSAGIRVNFATGKKQNAGI